MIKAFYSKSVHSCFSDCYFLQPTTTSSLSYPNILGILFSHILNLRIFSVDKKNQLDVNFCILYFSSNSC